MCSWSPSLDPETMGMRILLLVAGKNLLAYSILLRNAMFSISMFTVPPLTLV